MMPIAQQRRQRLRQRAPSLVLHRVDDFAQRPVVASAGRARIVPAAWTDRAAKGRFERAVAAGAARGQAGADEGVAGQRQRRP